MSEIFNEYLEAGAPPVLALDQAFEQVIQEANADQEHKLKRLDELIDTASQHPDIDKDVLIYVLRKKYEETGRK